MPEIASLELRVDSRTVDSGTESLNRFEKATTGADAASEKLAQTQSKTGKATESMGQSMGGAGDALNRLEKSTGNAEAAADKLTRTQTNTGKAAGYMGQSLGEARKSMAAVPEDMQRIVDRYDPLGSKLRKLQEDFKALDEIIKTSQTGGMADSSLDKMMADLNAEIAQTKSQMQSASVATEATAGTMERLGLNTNMARRNLMEMGNALARGDFTMAASQVAQLSGTTKIMSVLLNPLTIGIVAATGAIVGLAAAAVAGYNELKQMNQEIYRGGGYAGVTAGRMVELAKAMASSQQISLGAAKDIIGALVASGQISGEVIESIAAMAGKYAKATGIEVEKLGDAFVKLFSDPARGAEDLNKSMHLLNVAQLEQVRALTEAGDKMGAQRVLIDALNGSMDSQGDKVGVLVQNWRDLKTNIDYVIDALKELGKETTADEEAKKWADRAEFLTTIKTRIEALTGIKSTALDDFIKKAEDSRRQAEAEADGVQATVNARKDAAREIEKGQALLKEGEDSDTHRLRLLDARITRLNEETDLYVAQGGVRADIERTIYQLEVQRMALSDKMNGRPERFQQEQALTAVRLQAQKDYFDALNQLTDAAHKSGMLQDSEYYARKKQFLAEETAAEEKAAAENLARLVVRSAQTVDMTAKRQLMVQIIQAEAAAEKVKTDATLRALMLEQQRYDAETARVNVRNAADAAEQKDVQARVQGLERETAQIMQQGDAMRKQAATLGFTKSMLMDYAAAETEATAALLTRKAAMMDGTADQRELDALNAKIDALNRLAAIQRDQAGGLRGDEQLKSQADAAQKLADLHKRAAADSLAAWQKTGQGIAQAMRSAFGQTGDTLGQLMQLFAQNKAFQIQQAEAYAARRKELDKQNWVSERDYADAVAELRQRHADENLSATVGMYGNMASTAAQFFDQNSKGYNTLMAISKVFHAAEVAMQMAEMVPRAINAVLNQGKGEPYSAFARMAAMAAVVAGLGVAIGSISGGSGGSSGRSAEEIQARQGRGTVLGDAEAQSQSLKNALEELKSINLLGLTYSRGMLDALLAIQKNIGLFTAAVAQSVGLTTGEGLGIQTGVISVNNRDPAIYGFGTVGSGLGGAILGPVDSLARSIAHAVGLGGILDGLLALWGKTSVSIIDSGIKVTGSLQQLIQGQGYQQYATTRTNQSSWFGLVNNTSIGQVTGPLDERVARQFGQVIRGIVDTLEAAARILGVWTATWRADIEQIRLDLGEISLDGLTGKELEDAINAIFSTIADRLAGQAVPIFSNPNAVPGVASWDIFFSTFQRAGEGAFQTVVRIASQFDVVRRTFELLRTPLDGISMGTLKFTDTLITLMGGIDQFQKTMSSYVGHYYSAGEQRTMQGSMLETEFKDMGFGGASLTNLQTFRSLVEGIDRTTEAGAALYARMMQLEGAYYDYATTLVGLDGKVHQITEVEEQRLSFEDRRALARAGLDENERARIQQEIANRQLLASAITEENKLIAQQIIDQEAVNAAARKAADQRREIGQLEVDMLTAQGRSAEALAAQRRLDIEGMTAAEVAHYDNVQAIRQQIAVEVKLAELRRTVQQSEVELLKAQGKTAEALALQRRIDIAGMTDAEIALYDYNQAIREQIDLVNLQTAATNTQKDLAAQLYDVSHTSVEALQRQRDAQLALLTAQEQAARMQAGSLTNIQRAIYIWQDFNTLRDAATRAHEALVKLSKTLKDSFMDAYRQIEMAGMDNEQQYRYLQKEAAKYLELMNAATTTEDVQKYADKIRADMLAAFNLLSPEEQNAQRAAFLANINAVSAMVTAALNRLDTPIPTAPTGLPNTGPQPPSGPGTPGVPGSAAPTNDPVSLAANAQKDAAAKQAEAATTNREAAAINREAAQIQLQAANAQLEANKVLKRMQINFPQLNATVEAGR